MRDELAERALAALLGWEEPELVDLGSRLQLLARLKYDEYEGYRPGQKFLESFVALLSQLDESQRRTVVRFVLEDIVFVSRGELYQAIESVYPDIIRPVLIRLAAEDVGIERHHVRQVVSSHAFEERHRRSLVVGLSDGARLDKLRRTSGFSTEQFYQGPEFSEERITSLWGKLQADVPGGSFAQVFFVEDFAGSGFTLLRGQEQGEQDWDGKLWRVNNQMNELRGSIFAADVMVVVVLYTAAERALQELRTRLERAGLEWRVTTAQLIPDDLSIREPSELASVCDWFFDEEVLYDEHMRKGNAAPYLGFGGAGLPLVLHHNTPNNSISILWGDTSEEPSTSRLRRRALFPRYRRHR